MTVYEKNNGTKVVRDYNGRPLEQGESLALFPYNILDAKEVTNKDCLCTVSVAGHAFKCIKKAVPTEYVSLVHSQLTDWQEEVLPARRDGRCMIPQPDGSLKECPRKKADNHPTCRNCPYKGMYEKKVKNNVSIDYAMDEYELAFVSEKSPETKYLEQEGENATKEEFIRFVGDIIEKSPKHAYALLLMSLGFKGDRFAEQMRLSKMGANYVRAQIIKLAPNGISSLEQIEYKSFKASKNRNEEYYRKEAKNALKTVVKMYF